MKKSYRVFSHWCADVLPSTKAWNPKRGKVLVLFSDIFLTRHKLCIQIQIYSTIRSSHTMHRIGLNDDWVHTLYNAYNHFIITFYSKILSWRAKRLQISLHPVEILPKISLSNYAIYYVHWTLDVQNCRFFASGNVSVGCSGSLHVFIMEL